MLAKRVKKQPNRTAARRKPLASHLLAFLLAIFAIGCERLPQRENISSANRPLLIYIVSEHSSDLRDFSDLNAIIARHYNYRVRRLSGIYDRRLAEKKYHQGRLRPNWNKAIDYWEYLARRDPPGRLSRDDITFIREYEVTQAPSILVVYQDGYSQLFDRQLSTETFSALLDERRKCRKRSDCTVKKGELNEILSRFWNIRKESDRQELAKWLENRLLR